MLEFERTAPEDLVLLVGVIDLEVGLVVVLLVGLVVVGLVVLVVGVTRLVEVEFLKVRVGLVVFLDVLVVAVLDLRLLLSLLLDRLEVFDNLRVE